MIFTYSCKKTGTSRDVDVEALPPVSLEYSIRRGLREYFDNYHASETLKKHGTPEAVALAVEPMIDEAYDRLVAGDVPGSRGAADPLAAKVRAVLRTAKDSGVDVESIDPAALVAAIVKLAKKAA